MIAFDTIRHDFNTELYFQKLLQFYNGAATSNIIQHLGQ